MAGYRTALGRARGLGAAKHGVGHFIGQRVTAAALIPLVIWGVYSALALSMAGYDAAAAWLRSPVNAVLVVLLIAAGFWHMRLGLQAVIEDYVTTPLAKTAALLANLFVCAAGAALAIFCVLKTALSGAVA
jgi:succinate dehydrogenase / fumarate reductase membrane anchor subunit